MQCNVASAIKTQVSQDHRTRNYLPHQWIQASPFECKHQLKRSHLLKNCVKPVMFCWEQKNLCGSEGSWDWPMWNYWTRLCIRRSGVLWEEVTPCWEGVLSIEPLPFLALIFFSFSFLLKSLCLEFIYSWEEWFFFYLFSLGYTKYFRFELFGSRSNSESGIDNWNGVLGFVSVVQSPS